MSVESDQKLIMATADKLIERVDKLTKHDADISVAALGVAMMCLAKANDITRADINELLDLAEQELNDAVAHDS